MHSRRLARKFGLDQKESVFVSGQPPRGTILWASQIELAQIGDYDNPTNKVKKRLNGDLFIGAKFVPYSSQNSPK